ncbi:hypothetical protein [Xylophilus ampelinus]|nr:hypothetical protein [Xylophilus ampelinus]
MAKAMAPQHRPALTAIHNARNSDDVDLERMVANLEDISRWAAEVESEDFHIVNSHAFITLWAAQEAGIENILAEIIRTSHYAAQISSSKFPADRYPFSDWPWSESICIEIAQKLDTKAKNATKEGGDDIAERIVALFSWFDLDVKTDDSIANKYNEASMVRNVILHRYGHLNSRNVEKFPELSQWIGEILPITTERLNSYYHAVTTTHLAIAQAVWSSQYK